MSRSAFHYGPRRTFWQWVGDIEWGLLILKVVMAALLASIAVVAYVVPPQIENRARENERVAIECAAQPGHEPFRVSQYRVICLDKQDHSAPTAP
jgi:hypothetical protein